MPDFETRSYLNNRRTNRTNRQRKIRSSDIASRARADEIAAASGVSTRKLLNSSVGVFQITEPFSTEVSDYGMYNTSTRQKDITVTVRAGFLIE